MNERGDVFVSSYNLAEWTSLVHMNDDFVQPSNDLCQVVLQKHVGSLDLHCSTKPKSP